MENQDIRTLRLLEAVEKGETPSQRELARKLDISLGLVNAFLKRLARKGYFKITNLPANRIRYILTPKGLAEKSRLTCEYIQYSFGYYRQARAKLKKILAELEHNGHFRLVFWGTGELAEIAFVSLQDTSELEIVALVESGKTGGKAFGKNILPPEALNTLAFDRVLITVISEVDEALRELRELGIAEEKIVLL
jgi:DNA-binding MarR family transcriptional regulator